MELIFFNPVVNKINLSLLNIWLVVVGGGVQNYKCVFGVVTNCRMCPLFRISFGHFFSKQIQDMDFIEYETPSFNHLLPLNTPTPSRCPRNIDDLHIQHCIIYILLGFAF